MIAIIDYGLGNVGSIYNMLRVIGAPAVITKDPAEITGASKLILPGVGSFDQAITLLNNSGLRGLLEEKVISGSTPILGICLGMQIMTRGSEEGSLPGLGWFDAHCIKFSFKTPETSNLKIPHMGWNDIVPVNDPGNLFGSIDEELKFYFAHSYHLTDASQYEIASACYGYQFTVALKRGNILGVQFHPERSHMFGIHLFKAFADLTDSGC